MATFRTRIIEATRRLTQAHLDKIQAVHDHMAEMGATCSTPAPAGGMAESLREAEVLRVDDSFSARQEALRKACRLLFMDPDRPFDSPYCYIRDCFDTDVVVQVGDCFYQIPYTMDGDDPQLGEPMEVDIAYVPCDDSDGQQETAGDEIIERKIPMSVRKTYSRGDFAGKGTSFPIKKAEDVAAALKSIGRAGADNYDAATLKRNILRIAKRKGFPIPKADQKEMDSEKASGNANPVSEAANAELLGDFVSLRESAVDADGNAMVKIIAPGWGSSGYYSPEVLKRDGPLVFTEGTKMFWNHQTAAEEAARPEGDLDDLASKLTGRAVYMEAGSDGPGLYAPVSVYGPYREPINELAGDIGVSIRASGRAINGEAEGKTGPIIERIVQAKSIDYVTTPGAGGKVLQLFEAARSRNSKRTETEMDKQLLERVSALETTNQQLLKEAALREAGDYLDRAIADKAKALPAVSRIRVRAELLKAAPLKENRLDIQAFDKQIAEAIAEEARYVAQISGAGEIRGMGSAPTADDTKQLAEAETDLAGAFADFGMSESAAKRAAAGRK